MFFIVFIFLAVKKKGRKGYAVVIDTIYWCMFFITVFVLIKVNN